MIHFEDECRVGNKLMKGIIVLDEAGLKRASIGLENVRVNPDL